ncbi:MAG: GGDEF domain-containing protein, partial [candidate division Zixibacteria bacterium]|nr:GGDEF domain-containing protein [candidate division Zixibacteria bacterium]
MAWIHQRLKAKVQNLGVRARILEDLSAKDPLTGLFNFGYIRERLQIELERAKRFQTPLSCLMIDVDNLKQINDKHGHPAGDEKLRQIALLIQKEIRMIDTATR